MQTEFQIFDVNFFHIAREVCILNECKSIIFFFRFGKILTQLTTGGSRDAEMATPINGPAAPNSSATATPDPDVNALTNKTRK